MTHTKTKAVHPAVNMYLEEHKAGKMDRREFLTRATAMGVTTVAAYGLLGAAPASAAAHAQQGGTIQSGGETVTVPPHVSMKLEGVLMIAKGLTSVDELQRVLKG